MAKVIPEHMIPEVASELIERDGRTYLQSNEAMFTFYKRTKGELSPYFLGLRDERVIWGARCDKCGLVRVPPFELYCPDCDFAALTPVKLGDLGEMNSTPPITYFANSMFQSWVPFGRGRVMLDGADTGVPMHVYTTKGVLTPFIFKRGTRVKVVFRDVRNGKPTDVFAVPAAELTPEQLARSPLMESELDWSTPVEPKLAPATAEQRREHVEAVRKLVETAAQVERSPRAQANLKDWKREILVRTPAGAFTLSIDDRKLAVRDKLPAQPDLVMVVQEPTLLLRWLGQQESLTNAIIAGQLWISRNKEFTTVFKLDRLPRSLKREGEKRPGA